MKMIDIKSNIDFIKIILAKESFNEQNDKVEVWESGEKEECRKKYEILEDSLQKKLPLAFPLNIFIDMISYLTVVEIDKYVTDVINAIASEGRRLSKDKSTVAQAFLYQNMCDQLTIYKKIIVERIVELCNIIGTSCNGSILMDEKPVQQLTITGDNNKVYNNSIVSSHKSRPYNIDDDINERWGMVAEEPVYGYGMVRDDYKLDYGLIKEDFDYESRRKKKNDRWFSVKESKRPCVGEKYMICGYCYPGAVDYITGIYEGRGNWSTEYDNSNNPQFKVLYWRDIEEIKGVENEI